MVEVARDPPLLFFPAHAQPNGPTNINLKDGNQGSNTGAEEKVTCHGWLRPGGVFGAAVLVLPTPVAHKKQCCGGDQGNSSDPRHNTCGHQCHSHLTTLGLPHKQLPDTTHHMHHSPPAMAPLLVPLRVPADGTAAALPPSLLEMPPNGMSLGAGEVRAEPPWAAERVAECVGVGVGDLVPALGVGVAGAAFKKNAERAAPAAYVNSVSSTTTTRSPSLHQAGTLPPEGSGARLAEGETDAEGEGDSVAYVAVALPVPGLPSALVAIAVPPMILMITGRICGEHVNSQAPHEP